MRLEKGSQGVEMGARGRWGDLYFAKGEKREGLSQTLNLRPGTRAPLPRSPAGSRLQNAQNRRRLSGRVRGFGSF